MKRIGITAQVNMKTIVSFKMADMTFPQNLLDLCYRDQVMPAVLPITSSIATIDEMLRSVDGIIITGGSDVCTDLYGEKPLRYKKIKSMPAYYRPRDVFEIKLIRQAQRLRKPILGLCRGIQIINVALGGTLYQDLRLQRSHDSIAHFQHAPSQVPTHMVTIAKDSLLAKIFGIRAKVNSYHHQAVRQLGHGLRAVAKAPDGVIEGVESKDGLFQAVQWHPEQLSKNYPKQAEIFKSFFKRC